MEYTVMTSKIKPDWVPTPPKGYIGIWIDDKDNLFIDEDSIRGAS